MSAAHNEPKPVKIFYLSIDIETEGPRHSDYLFSIGVCLGPAEGPCLIKKRFNLARCSGDTHWPATMTFWSQHPEVYKELTSNSNTHPKTVLREFIQCLFDWAKMCDRGKNDLHYPSEIQIVSDAPTFDLPRIDILMNRYDVTEFPLHFLGNPQMFHDVHNPDTTLDLLGKQEECASWISDNFPDVVHDHRPENDAEYTYYQMVFLYNEGGSAPFDPRDS